MQRLAIWCAVLMLAMACISPAIAGKKKSDKAAAPAEPAFTPSVTIVPEVRTPQGEPRFYPGENGQKTLWQPGMPVYIGDRVSLKTFVSTGDVPLKEVRLRLDNEPLLTLTVAPWVVEVDTTGWKPGYHYVEAFAWSANPKVSSGSGTLVLFVQEPVPAAATSAPQGTTKTVTEAMQETTTGTAPNQAAGSQTAPAGPPPVPAHPGKAVPKNAQGVPLYQASLDVTIHARDPKVEQAVKQGQVIRVTGPTLFSVKAGPNARRYVYALSRQGQEIFRSEPLPISALVRLQPKVAGTGVGLNPGELTVWVWAGDNQGLYGAPEMVRVEIAPQP